MNAERRAWSFERWVEYSRNTPEEEELEREIVTTRAIDLNHEIPNLEFGNATPRLYMVTIFATLFHMRTALMTTIVLYHPELVDWNRFHISAVNSLDHEPTRASFTAAGLLCDVGNPRIFQHCDPCAVAKIVEGVPSWTGAECYVVRVSQHWAGAHMRDFFRQWDSLPLPLVDKMAVRATEHRNASVMSEINAHRRWREFIQEQQCAVLWLGGDAKGSKNAVHVLWQGQALGELIAQRMQYSYAEYTDTVFEERKKMKMDI